MKLKFTKKSIANLTCTAPLGRQFVRDTECRGLCVEVRSSGGMTYYLSYRDVRGHPRMHKLANALDITPQQARALCDRMRSKMAMGCDIAAERDELRTSPTLAQYFNNTYLPYVQEYKRSWKCDVSLYRNHIEAHIGSMYVDAIKPEHISLVMKHARSRLSDGSSNKLLIQLRYMFNMAIRWRTAGVTENPTSTQQIRKLVIHRERFLDATETQSLLAAVNRSPNRMLRYIIPMLLLTGARKREVLDARWSDIDRAHSFWRIPFTKSGRERHVPLSAAALELLERVPRRRHCEWIFANPRTLKPYGNLHSSWDTVRKRAGLADVRMHDLRHSFASFLVNAGCNLYEVQKILGHSSIQMTQRYSHLSQDSLLRAASHAGAVVTGQVQA